MINEPASLDNTSDNIQTGARQTAEPIVSAKALRKRFGDFYNPQNVEKIHLRKKMLI